MLNHHPWNLGFGIWNFFSQCLRKRAFDAKVFSKNFRNPWITSLRSVILVQGTRTKDFLWWLYESELSTPTPIKSLWGEQDSNLRR